jgi:hypothetical protein
MQALISKAFILPSIRVFWAHIWLVITGLLSELRLLYQTLVPLCQRTGGLSLSPDLGSNKVG